MKIVTFEVKAVGDAYWRNIVDPTKQVVKVFYRNVSDDTIRKYLQKFLLREDTVIRIKRTDKDPYTVALNPDYKGFSVWVGGGEVTDGYVTYKRAVEIADEYKEDGYDDVYISSTKGGFL